MRYTKRLILFFLLLATVASAQQVWRISPYYFQYKGLKADDSLYAIRMYAGYLNTDKLTIRSYIGSLSPLSVDSNGLAIGTTTGIAGTLLNINKVYASPTTNVTVIRSVPQVYETVTTHASGLIAGLFQPVITGANNKNWGAGAVQGISVAPTISSGATGLIPNVYGQTITKTFNASGVTVDTLVYRRTFPSQETTPSTVNHIIYDLVGIGMSIGGLWSRYDATGYKSYWGTGNQLFNTNVDNGFGEKIQVNGRVDASRATRGSNLVTKDQLDSVAATTILNQQVAVQTPGNFNISGNGIANRFLAAAGTAGGAMTHYTMATGGFVNRFTLDLTGTESGSNSGSNWQLNRWSDGGVSLGAALFVRRSDGFVGVGTTTPRYKSDVSGGVMYGDGIGTSIVTRNTNNTASLTNETVLNCTASITQTLPDAISSNYGKIFVVNKDYSGGSVTIASNSIDGSPTYTLTDTLQSVTLISSGVSWRVISTKIGPLGFRRPAATPVGIVYGDGTIVNFPTNVDYLILRPTANNTIDLSTAAHYSGSTGRVAVILNTTNFTYQIAGTTVSSKYVYVAWYATDTPAFINL